MVFFHFRKIKILIYVTLLFALCCVYNTNGLNVGDLVHLVKNGVDGDEGFCIAFGEETYSAIEWSYPIPDNEYNLPETVSTYVPTQSSYGCNFEENQECNNSWKLDNWTIPSRTPRNYIPIFDTRWEDFRIYLTTNKTIISDNRLEIPKNSDIGISIRSGNTVDILLCDGFNPESYQCYTITVGGSTKKEVYLAKSGIEDKLAEYKSNVPILSSDEWKHFILSSTETGQIQFKDINKNFWYLNVTDFASLNIIYLFMNSSLPSLWKIHQNHFLFTNVSQHVPFGPPINASSSTICLSMYLMMCKNCNIYFYTMMNNTQEISLQVHPEKRDNISHEWQNIRVIIENITFDMVQIYVKTNGNATDRFWAIDNVRTCINEEFKIRKILKGNYNQALNFNDPTFSCHSLKFPGRRPKPQVIPTADLPVVTDSPNTTSIQLSWKTSNQQPYLINYKGSDLCSRDLQYKNIHRLKSSGWIIAKQKENTITIKDLIPYTHYDVSFIDPIYQTNKTLSISTNPTDIITEDELPKVDITPKENEVTVNISSRICNTSYGHVVYRLDILQLSNPYLLTDDSYVWKNLEPYTNYTLSVETARSVSNLNSTMLKTTSYYNFATKPDVAPPLEFAELYEISQTSVSFRYRLPKKTNGVPVLLQTAACNKFQRNNCNYTNMNITRCDFWKDLFCVTINELMGNTSYNFKLSFKNNNTNAFGKQVEITQKTIEKVPGRPTNLSYNINCSKESEFCNLNISWSHPYNQTGVIISFEISLEDKDQAINEYVLVENKKYLPVYWHVVRYIPFAETYNVSIRACNSAYKGQYASITVNIGHIAQHIDQLPKILENNQTGITFQIPKLNRELNSSFIIIIVQVNDSTYTNISQDIVNITQDSLCLQNKTSWIAGYWKISHNDTTNITLGNNENTFVDVINNTVINKPLLPKTEYCVNFVIKNVYKNVGHVRVYHKKHVVLLQQEPITSAYRISIESIIGFTLLILLIAAIIVIAVLTYRKRNYRSRQRTRTRSDAEHIYEAMPADDYDDEPYNVVYNATYDKLDHD